MRNCLYNFYCRYYHYHDHGIYFEIVYVVVLFELVRLAYLSGRLEKMMREIMVMGVTLHIASLWQIARSGRHHFVS